MKRLLKVLGMAGLAGALKAVSDQLPNVLPAGQGDIVAVALAAAIAYLIPAPAARKLR